MSVLSKRLVARAAIPLTLALTCLSGLAEAAPPSNTADAEITIYRDKMGVPHVFADTAPAVFYGVSYAMAEDRLAEADISIRSANGRMAELKGESAVATDARMRLLRATDEELKTQFAALPADVRAILKAGYQGYIARVRKVRADPSLLPYEFVEWGVQPTEWSFWEYLNTSVVIARFYGSAGGHELGNLEFYRFLKSRFDAAEARKIFDDVLPLQDVDATPFIPERDRRTTPSLAAALFAPRTSAKDDAAAPALFARQAALPITHLAALAQPPVHPSASRALLIGASKSASGNPMILQATADGPDVHFSGGGFDAAGYSQAWGGSVAQGRTPYFAWSITTGEADMIDIFAEKTNPLNPRQYFYKGAWRDMQVRKEVINVRGGAPVVIEVETTAHGPIVQREDADHTAYSMDNAMAGHDLAAFVGIFDLNRARNLEDYKKAAAEMVGSFNVNYAGTDGHIATMHAGLLPVRANGVDPRLPTPGTGEYDWKGFARELAFTVDPDQGYLHVWNNKPTAGTTYGDTSRYGKAFRTWQGRGLAESKAKISREDLHEFHRLIGRGFGGEDTSVTNPRFFTPYLKRAVAGDARLEAAVAAIEAWNGVYADKDGDGFYDSPGLPAYRTWIAIAQTEIIGHEIGDWWHRIDDDKYVKYRTDVLLRAIEGGDAGVPMRHDWFAGKSRDAVLRQTVADTVAALEKQYGSPDPRAWRQRVFYRYYLDSAIAKNPDKPSLRALPGGEQDVGPALAAPELGLQPPYVVDNGSEAWNMLVEVKKDDPVLYDSTPSGGQNLNVTRDGKGNPNIADQVKLHQNFEFKAVDLDRARIVRDAVSLERIRYSPTGGD